MEKTYASAWKTTAASSFGQGAQAIDWAESEWFQVWLELARREDQEEEQAGNCTPELATA